MISKVIIDFKKSGGLVPVIIQNCKTKEILMLGYMNKIAFDKTLTSRYVYFWSRNRNEIWQKGQESGNKLKVIKLLTDCDNDTILIMAKLEGKNVCHTGRKTCFFKEIK